MSCLKTTFLDFDQFCRGVQVTQRIEECIREISQSAETLKGFDLNLLLHQWLSEKEQHLKVRRVRFNTVH